MATFDKAPDRVDGVIRKVMGDIFPDLVEAEARIGAVFAYPALDKDGVAKGPPMVKKGRRVFARIKINSEEDRAAGKADATITIDADEWKRMDEMPDRVAGRDEQEALVAHELEHLIVQRDKVLPGQKRPGKIKTDDKGRPLFTAREHDWEVTGFRRIAEYYGKRSYEIREARQFHDQYGNLLFGFASDRAVQRDKERPRDFIGEVFDQVAEEINAGALGPGLTATVSPSRRRRGAAAVAAANR